MEKGERSSYFFKVELPGRVRPALPALPKLGIGADEYRDSPIDRTLPDHHYSCVLLKPFTKGGSMAPHTMAGHTMAHQAGHSARILSHLFFLALTLFVGAGLAHGASAYIRVNQVGYVGSSTKRAYLMASGSESGAAFAVKHSAGSTVYSAPVGHSLGAGDTFPRRYSPPLPPPSTA